MIEPTPLATKRPMTKDPKGLLKKSDMFNCQRFFH
jgi:hypothetical protein